MLGRFLSAFRELPLLYRIVSVVLGAGLVVGLIFKWDWRVGLAALCIIAGVIALLFLIQFVLKRWEKRRNSELAGALEGGDSDISAIPDEERRQAVAEVREQWNRAVTELKGTGMNLYSLPWYMLIGEPACGKSTTLKNSGMEFPVGTEGLSGSGGTRNCDWWFTNEAVILDTAGRFTFEERNAPDSLEWQEFLGLLKKYRPRCPINGVIVAIPATSLLGDPATEIERKAKTIREKLTQLEQELEVQFPVYLVVTKCDLLLGFAEFFQRLPALEQRQLFGWSKPQPYDELFPQEQWPGIFQEIRQRLHVWRNRFLADDSEAGDVDRLYAFPDEFEALEDPLKRYLGEIFVANRYLDPLFFRGIYFSSGLQKGKPIVKACSNLLRAAAGGPDEVDLSSLFQKSTAFFVRDFYRKKLFKEQGLLQPTRLALKRRRVVERVGYGVAGVAGLVMLFLLIYGGIVQGSGARDMNGKLQALETASKTWVKSGENDVSTLPLKESSELATEIRSARENDSLDPGILAVGSIGTMLENLGKSYTALTSETTFRVLGERALAGLSGGRPQSWYEQEEYHQSLQLYLTLLKDADSSMEVPPTDDRRDFPWTLQPLLALLERREQITPSERKVFEAEYQGLLDVCRAAAIGRPCLREAFLPKKNSKGVSDVVGGLLEHYVAYWKATAAGSDTIVGLIDGKFQELGKPKPVNSDDEESERVAAAPLPAEILTAAIWIRAREINLSCETARRDSRRVTLTGLEDFEEADEKLSQWDKLLSATTEETFFHRMDEAAALEKFTEDRKLSHFRDSIGKLTTTCDERLATLQALSPDEESGWDFTDRLERDRTDRKEDLDKARTNVRTRFFDEDRVEFVLRVSGQGEGPFALETEGKYLVEMQAMRQCHDAVVAALAQDTAEKLYDLDLILAQRVDVLKEAFTSAEKLLDEDKKDGYAPLIQHLEEVIALAQQVLVARELTAYPREVEENRERVLAGFVESQRANLSELLVEAWTIDDRNRREVAVRVIQHADYLIWLSLDDGNLAKFMRSASRSKLRKQADELLREYLRGYEATWDEKWGAVFGPKLQEIALDELTWPQYWENLKTSFGLASGVGTAKDSLQRALKTLEEHLDFSGLTFRSEEGGKLPSDPTIPLRHLKSLSEFREAFAGFLAAFREDPPEEGAEPVPSIMAEIVRTFGSFIEGARSLRLETSKFASKLSQTDSKGRSVRDELAECEEVFVRRPSLKEDRVGSRVYAVIEAGREKIEAELREQFLENWDALGDQYASRLNTKAPFVKETENGPAVDVGRTTFVTFREKVLALDKDWGLFYRDERPTHVSLRLDGGRENVPRFILSLIDLGKHMGLDEKSKVELTFTANYTLRRKDQDFPDGEVFPEVGQYSARLATKKARIIEFAVRIGVDGKKTFNAGGLAEPGRRSPFTWSYASESGQRLRLEMIGNDGRAIEDRPWPPAKLQNGWFALARLLWRNADLTADEKRENWLLLHELPDIQGGESTVALHVVQFAKGQGLPERPDFKWTGWTQQ